MLLTIAPPTFMVAVDLRIARVEFSQVLENKQKNGCDEPVTGVLREGSLDGPSTPAAFRQILFACISRMQDNRIMQNPKGSSIRVSSVIRRRVGSLARRLKASSQEEVIDRALDALERAVFWQGFNDEAEAYLKKYPQ